MLVENMTKLCFSLRFKKRDLSRSRYFLSIDAIVVPCEANEQRNILF